jgi:hypothetical protein
MTQATFKVAGTTKLNGVTKVRFANDIMRVKNLAKGGHENIDIIELPQAMTKPEVVAYLQSIDFANGDMDKAAALASQAEKRGLVTKAKKASKVKDSVPAVETEAEVA